MSSLSYSEWNAVGATREMRTESREYQYCIVDWFSLGETALLGRDRSLSECGTATA